LLGLRLSLGELHRFPRRSGTALRFGTFHVY
jgi:hypothetical protein